MKLSLKEVTDVLQHLYEQDRVVVVGYDKEGEPEFMLTETALKENKPIKFRYPQPIVYPTLN